MSTGFSKFIILVIVTIVIGFFIVWDLQRRQMESLESAGFDTEVSELVPEDAGEVLIPVDGMTCLSGEITIERALTGLDGVYRADASIKEKSVVVRYDPNRVSLSQMREEVEKAGYSAGEPIEK